MSDIVRLPDLPPVHVRRNPRSATIRLAHDGRGGFRLSAPPDMRDQQIRAFVERHRGWIARLAEQAAEIRPFVEGALIPVLGADRRLTLDPSLDAPRLDADTLKLPAGCDVSARTTTFLKRLCAQEAEQIARRYAAELKPRIPLKKVVVKDARTRWGSASGRGNVNINWRLAMAPAEVLDYVVAHEVTHLEHMDHSPRFWATCKRLAPHTDRAEKWLDRHGKSLRGLGPQTG